MFIPIFHSTDRTTVHRLGTAGVPSSDDIEAVHSQYAKTMMETMMQPHSNPNKLRDMFPDAPDDALDLMQKLLQFNPQKRLTAEEALQHPYVAHFHNPEDEPVAAGPITIPVDDNKKVLSHLLMYLIWLDIMYCKIGTSLPGAPLTVNIICHVLKMFHIQNGIIRITHWV